MNKVLRSLVFQIGFDVNRNPLVQTNRSVDDLKSKTDRASTSIRGMETRSNALGSALKRVAVGAGVMVASYVSIQTAIKGIKLASDFTEDQTKMEAVFGKSTQAVNEQIKAMGKLYHMGNADYVKQFGNIGALFKGFGLDGDALVSQSRKYIEQVQDISSFYNLSVEEAQTKLKSAIVGEAEPIRAIGIDVSVASMKEYSKTIGVAWDGLKRQEQSMLRLRFIGEQLKKQNALGDFLKTGDGFANVTRQVGSLSKDFMVKLFTPLKDMLIPYLIQARDWFEKNNEKVAQFGDMIKNVGLTVVKVIKFLESPLGKVVLTLGAVYGGALAVSKGFDIASNSVKGASEGFRLMNKVLLWDKVGKGASGLKDLSHKLKMTAIDAKTFFGAVNQSMRDKGFVGSVKALGSAITGFGKTASKGMADAGKGIGKSLVGMGRGFITCSVQVISSLWAMSVALFTTPIGWIILGIVGAVALLTFAIIDLWKGFHGGNSVIFNTFNFLKGIATSVWNFIVALFKDRIERVLSTIKLIKETFAGVFNGVKQILSGDFFGGVKTIFSSLGEGLKGYFSIWADMFLAPFKTVFKWIGDTFGWVLQKAQQTYDALVGIMGLKGEKVPTQQRGVSMARGGAFVTAKTPPLNTGTPQTVNTTQATTGSTVRVDGVTTNITIHQAEGVSADDIKKHVEAQMTNTFEKAMYNVSAVGV